MTHTQSTAWKSSDDGPSPEIDSGPPDTALSLLREVSRFHHGVQEYNFSGLIGQDRDNASCDAWNLLDDRITSLLRKEGVGDLFNRTTKCPYCEKPGHNESTEPCPQRITDAARFQEAGAIY